METLVEGLEVFSSNFLLAIKEKNRQGLQRMFWEKKSKGGGKGLRELRSLVSSINYDSASSKSRGSNRERAVIVSQ